MNSTDRPVAVDLFAGAGGMSLGFEQAGFEIAAAVEIDPVHAAAHHFNFPDCAILPQNITELTGGSIRQTAGLGNKSIDVVCGGAPCQGFSLIGKRALDDPRNGLVKDFVRIVCELDARAFVFENVKGLTLGRHRRFLDEFIQEFETAGYAVLTPVKVLNAANFGVPQNRERLFVMGVKSGESLPQYPIQTTRNPKKTKEYGKYSLPDAPTCMDAICDLPEAEKYDALLYADEVKVSTWGIPTIFGLEMRTISETAWHFGHPRQWNPELLTSSQRTEHSPISRRRFHETQQGAVEPISRFYKLSQNGISNTLRAGTDAARGAFTSPRPIHYSADRCITVREMARLHGFPDWFRFHATKWHGARQIGNAVPPPLARAVARQVLAALAFEPKISTRLVALGNSNLLRMNISQAARFWEVDAPLGKRDRKSGATKRNQLDIEAHRLNWLAAE